MRFPTRICVSINTSSEEGLFRESEPEKLLATHEAFLAHSGEPREVLTELVEEGHANRGGEQHVQ